MEEDPVEIRGEDLVLYDERRKSYRTMRRNAARETQLLTAYLPPGGESTMVLASGSHTRPRGMTLIGRITRTHDPVPATVKAQAVLRCVQNFGQVSDESGESVVTTVMDKRVCLSLGDDATPLLYQIEELQMFLKKVGTGDPTSWTIELVWRSELDFALSPEGPARVVDPLLLTAEFGHVEYTTEQLRYISELKERTDSLQASVKKYTYYRNVDRIAPSVFRTRRMYKRDFERGLEFEPFFAPPGVSERFVDTEHELQSVYHVDAELTVPDAGAVSLFVYTYRTGDVLAPRERRPEHFIMALHCVGQRDNANQQRFHRTKTKNLRMARGDIFYVVVQNDTQSTVGVGISYVTRFKRPGTELGNE